MRLTLAALVFFIYPTLLSWALPPPMINIFTPNERANGPDDLLANIWMARKLREKVPEAAIAVYIDPSFRQDLKFFFPELALMEDGDKADDGISFYFSPKASRSSDINSASYNVSFSFHTHQAALKEETRENVGHFDLLKDNTLIIFDDYESTNAGQVYPRDVLYNPPKDGLERSKGDKMAAKIRTLIMTGPSGAGLYISPAPAKKTNKTTNKTTAKVEQVLRGYCNSDQKESAEIYIEAMRKFAEASENAGKKISLKVREDSGWNLPRPPNLIVQTFTSAPLAEMERDIEQAELPVMVTGVMGATLALEREKAFFYEELEDKADFIDQLNYQLSKTEKTGAGSIITYVPVEKSYEVRSWKPAQTVHHFKAAQMTLLRPRDIKRYDDLTAEEKKDWHRNYIQLKTKEMVRALHKRNEQQKLKDAMADLRRDASLPDKFIELGRLAITNARATEFSRLNTDSMREKRLSEEAAAAVTPRKACPPNVGEKKSVEDDVNELIEILEIIHP